MTSHPAGPTVNGELARLEFELWAESVGKSELIGTSREEVAQEALGQIPAGRKFGPRAHLLGGSFFPDGIEQSLIGAPIGEEITKEFAPADAFGERDPKLIELFSMHEVERLPEMRREDAHLDIGTVLSIRGREGRVVTLTQARVRVDFNPPFAGRKVRGKFRFTERITEPVDQVRALIEIEYGRAQEFHVELHEHVVTVKVPDRAKFDPAWFTDKPRIVDRVRTQL
ncbi:MAG: FKBP-type peptidyl-prolyl cis-trans isomerase, partial [Thermoplasmata archaeon]